MSAPRTLRRRARRGVASALHRRLEAVRHGRDDSGQIIVIIVILVVLLSVLGPLMASQITSDAPLVVLSTNKHAALAAAESGIEWYRNHLDANPNYYLYSASNPPSPADPAMLANGWCSSACDLGGTSPSEAFHYVPNDSTLFATSGTNAGRVVLTVTGRGGSAGSYVYVTARASFTASSILANAYFSNTEVLDPLYPDEQQTGVSVTGLSAPQGITTYPVTYPVNGTDTTTSLWNALCGYQTYQANTFLDWLGQTQNTQIDAESATNPSNVTVQAYTPTHPYYGPYYGVQGFSFTNGNGETVSVPGIACGGTFDFNTGESFAGPVYSNDQLHVCGSPTFSGSPISYTSGVSSNVAYAYDWLGSVEVTPKTGSPYYAPDGTTVDPVQGYCGRGAAPNFVHGSSLNGSLVLPSWNTQLASAAAAGGCLFTGPTMIALVTSSTGTTMNVWSPLSGGANAPAAACSTGKSPTGASLTSFGQSFSGSSGPYITGIPLPSNGVVFVQNAGAAASAPTVQDGLNSTNSGCINPYVNLTQANNPILPTVTKTSATCLEGDAFVEGELKGELTIGSAANIIITRDLTYACADGTSGPASRSDPSSVAACTTGTTPDVLGLEAFDNVLISHPVSSPYSAAQMASGTLTNNGVSMCTYDGTAATAATLAGGTSGDPTSGKTIGEPVAVWPSCDIANPIVDAAVISLNGALGVEFWDQGSPQASNGVFLNGADISQYRGPFGLMSPYYGTWGYDKQFSFDSRLQFLQPPDALQSAVTSWQDLGYVVCGNANIATEPTPVCPPLG
ncbi:MAG: hypothetical protein M0Z33_06625 [Actinomycetota bacterium]|nr:hypothetical protein [Actinomycetota bacterium]